MLWCIKYFLGSLVLLRILRSEGSLEFFNIPQDSLGFLGGILYFSLFVFLSGCLYWRIFSLVHDRGYICLWDREEDENGFYLIYTYSVEICNKKLFMVPYPTFWSFCFIYTIKCDQKKRGVLDHKKFDIKNFSNLQPTK